MADTSLHRRDSYEATRARVETYFDSTATKVWERLTSDAPVSGIRATVREGRNRMRALMLAQLPGDLAGARVLDAGCGTGAMSAELAARGADVVAVDISPRLIEIAARRCPQNVAGRIDFRAGDMLDARLGRFDYAMAMDSLIYYDSAALSTVLTDLAPRIGESLIFTLPPRTPLLMAMFRAGKLFPRRDRSPAMIPQNPARLSPATGALREIERISAKFYISTAIEYRP